jgi:hypothetical protein
MIKNIKRWLLCSWLLTSMSIFADISAGEFYVSNLGNDSNPGSMERPWKTIQKAADNLVAGQTAYIRGGNYYEKIIIKNSGKAGEYITLSAYANEKPIVDGQGSGTLISLNYKRYIKIYGLQVQNGDQGIRDGLGNIIIENNTVKNIKGNGIKLINCSVSQIRGNVLENCVHSGYGECLTFTLCEYIDIIGNEVKNGNGLKGGEGINVKGSRFIRIFNNFVHDLENKGGIYIDSYDGYQHDIEIFNNTVYNNPAGIIIASECKNALENIDIYNNVLYNINGVGIGIMDWVKGTPARSYPIKNVKIENNTIVITQYKKWNAGVMIEVPQAKNISVKNNILYNLSTSLYIVPGAQVQTSNNYTQNPLFINSSKYDFHLSSASPAINAGFDTGLKFDRETKSRSGIDIGAYEYGGSRVALPAALNKPASTYYKTTISNADDDGTEANGIVSLQGNLDVSSGSYGKRIVAIRFPSVNIEKTAKIQFSRLDLTWAVDKSSDQEWFNIWAEYEGSSSPLTGSRLSSRKKTTSYSACLTGSNGVGNAYRSPDLTQIINEVISRSDWKKGQPITFLIEYDNYLNTNNRRSQFYSYDIKQSAAPSLLIEMAKTNSPAVTVPSTPAPSAPDAIPNTPTPSVPVVIPTLPSPINPAPLKYMVSASGESSSNSRYNVFDGIYSSYWVEWSSGSWLTIRYPEALVFNEYSIVSNPQYEGYDPKNWIIVASNDNKDWDQLDSRPEVKWSERMQVKTYSIANAKAYLYYAIIIKQNNGGNGTGIAELTFRDTAVKKPIAISRVSSRGEDSYYCLENTFDKNYSSDWIDWSKSTWLTIEYAQPVLINEYAITSGQGYSGYDPKSWTIYGSHDGYNWQFLDKKVEQNWSARTQRKGYLFSNDIEYKHYSFIINSNNGGNGVSISELEFLQTYVPEKYRVLDVITNMKNVMFPIENATDGLFSTYSLAWAKSGWIQFIYEQEVVMNNYTLVSTSAYSGYDPKDWQIFGSKDGIQWVRLDRQFGVMWSGRYQTKKYSFVNNTAYRYYALDIINNNGGAGISLTEICFGSTGITCRGQEGSSVKENAFDNNPTTTWVDIASETWIQIESPHSLAAREYEIICGNTYLSRSPRDWNFYGSNDGASYTLLDSRQNEIFTSYLQSKTYKIDNGQNYRYYKLEITANNGAADRTEIAELKFK